MSKVKKITVSNLKAVSSLTADFNGCTAILTGGNDKGKTTFLRGIFDRMRGVKADRVLKDGETEGFAEAELTTGEKIKWEFNDKGKGFKEKLTYITEKDIKTSLTVDLRNRFAPEYFNVDKFLNDAPAKQRKTLQDIAGIDFTEIDNKYDIAYKERTIANSKVYDTVALFNNAAVPEDVKYIDISELLIKKDNIRNDLNKLYVHNKSINDGLRKKWNLDCVEINNKNSKSCEIERSRVESFNKKVATDTNDYNKAYDALQSLISLGYKGDAEKFVSKMASAIDDEISYNEPELIPLPVEPKYIDELPDNSQLLSIEKQIEEAHETNRKFSLRQEWEKLKSLKDKAIEIAEKANECVKSIENDRLELIKTANLPEGFSFTDEGISYNNMAFTREQLSSSGIYIAALKLASMNIGEIRMLHFDASFLDKKSLSEIELWANKNDLQLLIERPNFEGGEIEYQILTA